MITREITVLGLCVASSSAIAQGADVSKDTLDRLQQQPSAQMRKMTIVPATDPSTAGTTVADDDRLRSLQDLLKQVERNKGAETGTVTAVGANAGQVFLQHDLSKVRQSYSRLTDAPFGELLSTVAPGSAETIATASAPFEYKVNRGHDFAQRIVSIKSKNSVAANAFQSGEKPVSLEVSNANLVATQVSGPESHLPVNVKVGEVTRQLNVGDTSRFGNFDVTILASSNNSIKLNREGLPYALRVQIMPAE